MSEVDTGVPRILVVDDEERIRDACSMVLEDEGYTVATADNGQVGLQMLEEEHFDVMLLDLMMPVLSGLDALPQLTERHPDTTIIVITGYATVEHSIEAMKKGAFDFIPKPFSPDQLRAVVSKAIRYTQALQDISDSKSRLRVMVNRLMDGVMTTDGRRQIVLANPSFLQMVGYAGSVVNGKKLEDVVAIPSILEMIEEALSMPADTLSESYREFGLKIGGEERIISARCAPFRSRTGATLGTTTVLHDITAMKEMDRMKSDFVSMVSHEIRSPMNSLLAQIKIIQDGLAGDVTEKQQEILSRAKGKINNLVDLVSELLDLSKMEAGMAGQSREDVDMASLMRDQVEFHGAGADLKKIRIDLQIDEHLPVIQADIQGMEEIATNLITNAIKYSPEDSQINIALATENDYLTFKVSDTGYGIPEEDLAEIFSRFYRVKDKNTRAIHGTGLGLAIVKTIIDNHKGSIRVESKLEKGTTFTVWLPLAEI